MKYFYLFLFIVYFPLIGVYLYQRGNEKYKNFTWGNKNRVGVWLSIILMVFLSCAKLAFPSFVNAVNIGWEDYEGHRGGEFYYCLQWLIALFLLIFPHLIKKENWSNNPSPSQYHDRFNADGYWYAGLIFSLLPIYNTWTLIR